MEPLAAGMLIAALVVPLVAVWTGWLMRGPAVDRETDRANRLEAERDEARAACRELVARERAIARGVELDAQAHRAVADAVGGGLDDDDAVDRLLDLMRARERARAAATAPAPLGGTQGVGGGGGELGGAAG